jgi:hypothetical protein
MPSPPSDFVDIGLNSWVWPNTESPNTVTLTPLDWGAGHYLSLSRSINIKLASIERVSRYLIITQNQNTKIHFSI